MCGLQPAELASPGSPGVGVFDRVRRAGASAVSDVDGWGKHDDQQ